MGFIAGVTCKCGIKYVVTSPSERGARPPLLLLLRYHREVCTCQYGGGDPSLMTGVHVLLLPTFLYPLVCSCCPHISARSSSCWRCWCYFLFCSLFVFAEYYSTINGWNADGTRMNTTTVTCERSLSDIQRFNYRCNMHRGVMLNQCGVKRSILSGV